MLLLLAVRTLWTEAVVQTCSVKKVFSEISQNSLENTCAGVSFSIKLQTLAQVFSCEFCEFLRTSFIKIIPIKHNHQPNFGFFSNSDFPSRIFCDFFKIAFFWRSYFFTFFQSNYIDLTVTFSEQLFVQNSCFFYGSLFSEQSFFRNSYFFRVASFSERNFYRAASF